MFSLGGAEWFIIILVAFLVFGPDKLPQIARTVGKYLRQFRTMQSQMSKKVKEEIYDPIKEDLDPLVKDLSALKNPLEGLENPFKDITNPLKDPINDIKNTFAGLKDAPVDAASAVGTADGSTAVITSSTASVGIAGSSDSFDPAAFAAAAGSSATITSASSAAPAAPPARPVQPTESFAERRARLEKEYADKKASAASSDSPT
ncbi:MAG: twin-arginine translocase TatA/TatE family subunit [Coriobacteriia bacterium]|nr:twin-arginine translocase TatA/TatE family subunit [Coriobacteriia bacterium]